MLVIFKIMLFLPDYLYYFKVLVEVALVVHPMLEALKEELGEVLGVIGLE